MNREFYEKLCGCMEQERVKVQEPMAKHTTFRLGGTADYYVMPKSEEEIRALISLCRREEVPYYIVGNGSNLLVSDAGYRDDGRSCRDERGSLRWRDERCD